MGWFKKNWPWALGGTALAGGALYLVTKKPTTDAGTSMLTGANPVPILPDDAANPSGRTIGPLAQGTIISLNLPAGATWTSLTTPQGAAIHVSGSNSAGVTINQTGALIAKYNDTTGPHTATVNVQMA
jgi:hypothetical protein